MTESRHVLLVGGPPGAGKTTLGKAIAADLGWPSVTGDDLATAIKAMIGPDDRPELHPTFPVGSVRYFTDGPPELLISDAEALESALWPAFENVIRMHATRTESIVLDWWLLSPDKVAGLDLGNVTSVWIDIDPAALWRRERANATYFGQSEQPERMLANFMQRSLWRNELIKTAAARHGMPSIRQPGNRSVAELVREVRSLPSAADTPLGY